MLVGREPPPFVDLEAFLLKVSVDGEDLGRPDLTTSLEFGAALATGVVFVVVAAGCFPMDLPKFFLDRLFTPPAGLFTEASVPSATSAELGTPPLQCEAGAAVEWNLAWKASATAGAGLVPGEGEPGGSPHRLTEESLFSLLAELSPLLLLGRLDAVPLDLSWAPLSLELKNLNLSSIELLLRLTLAALFAPAALCPAWPLAALAGCCCLTGTPTALLTGRWEMDEAEAVDDGLDLSEVFRSRVITADLG